MRTNEDSATLAMGTRSGISDKRKTAKINERKKNTTEKNANNSSHAGVVLVSSDVSQLNSIFKFGKYCQWFSAQCDEYNRVVHAAPAQNFSLPTFARIFFRALDKAKLLCVCVSVCCVSVSGYQLPHRITFNFCMFCCIFFFFIYLFCTKILNFFFASFAAWRIRRIVIFNLTASSSLWIVAARVPAVVHCMTRRKSIIYIGACNNELHNSRARKIENKKNITKMWMAVKWSDSIAKATTEMTRIKLPKKCFSFCILTRRARVSFLLFSSIRIQVTLLFP